MALDVHDLLNLPVWRAWDIDEGGRILAGNDDTGSMQLVELPGDGTVTRLTALPGACTGRYLPGTRSIVVSHDNGGDERSQLSTLSLDAARTGPVGLDGLVPLVHDERFIHNLTDVSRDRIVYTTNRRNRVDFDVVSRDTTTGTETVVYDRGGMIFAVSMAADGRHAIAGRAARRALSQQLLALRIDDGELRELTGVDEPAQHFHAYWCADGTVIATTDRDREFTMIARLDPATGVWTELVADHRHDVTGWLSPDERLLLVHKNNDGTAELSLHDAEDGRQIRRFDLPDLGWTGEPGLPTPVWSPDSRFVAICFASPVIPGDILRVEVSTGTVTTVMDSTGPLEASQLVQPTMHRIPSFDGMSIPCFLYPASPSGNPALAGSSVLVIHGGPASQSIRTFNPMIQAFAAAGHTVLVPNVRGSVGYGKTWYSADDVRLRLDSVADLRALHTWLPSRGLDPYRAALWGGSYGGYMVLAGLAFQPELWAAGVDIVGISSLVTFLENTSAYRRVHREREYGSLEGDREFLESASPLGRVDEIRAPLFVIHGANDPRVPRSEAEQLVKAVRANAIECELAVYADEGHGLAKRINRLDAYPRALAFLARHLAIG